ncbi:L-rhamnose mutarotase [Sphingomonas sp. PAMC 26605]|uniref:L-rhamnose mutarotase n=1 Tax=Sphingomonas sp. PAMC 26605 TaxID=1112214 RepID=UPI00026CABA7|nr:L-rhamnose mutarotase [Sphingomonas sp. PAMC 26605]
MEKIAFRMQLKPGMLDAYRRHHDAIAPELVALLRGAGIQDYSIHHDAHYNALFATLWRADDHAMDDLPKSPVMLQWWDMMAPLMETDADGMPVSVPLDTVFHLP